MQPKLALQQRQSQQLVMTQQLRQSIELLQMNAMELATFIQDEVEKNPLLTAEEASTEEREAANAEENDAREEEAAPVDENPKEPMKEAEEAVGKSSDDDSNWDYAPAERITIKARTKDGDEWEAEDTREIEKTLKEHLTEQWLIECQQSLPRTIGLYLIDLVDEAGYIKEELTHVANQLGCKVKDVETALKKLQQLDPAGVCARNLEECLRLQLTERGPIAPAMDALLSHMHLLADGNVAGLSRKCGVEAGELKSLVAELRSLDPKPGLKFSQDVVETVIPDVAVKPHSNTLGVELTSSAIPKVLLDKQYASTIETHAKDAADKKYLSEQMSHANWLIKALDQRSRTLLSIATAIVKEQESFFRMGIHHLKPLTLKDIAANTGFHESTVSRITNGKYIVSPRGTYELKYFFTSGVNHSAGGDDVSSQTVKHVIKEIIDKEDPKQILSDDEIVALLKKQNITIARRTVTKYREALGVGSSVDRRRQKLAGRL